MEKATCHKSIAQAIMHLSTNYTPVSSRRPLHCLVSAIPLRATWDCVSSGLAASV